jgi:hypothetical protein
LHSIRSAQSQQYRTDTSRAGSHIAYDDALLGFDISETSAKLMELSANAQENGRVNAELTAQNAADAVERKGQKAGRG